jgi:hypothetical protein
LPEILLEPKLQGTRRRQETSARTSVDLIVFQYLGLGTAAHGGSNYVSGDGDYTANKMTIAYSTFTENNAQQGAALYLDASATVTVSLSPHL